MRKNPFARQPIDKLASLTARTKEINELSYCFELTASNQSHHCAIIGARGVGKSSIIQSSKELAIKHKLVPVVMELDNGKVKTVFDFWENLYITMCSALAEQGCWGGLNGESYNLLVESFQRKVPEYPLQFPRFWHPREERLMSCPSALIKQDLVSVSAELSQIGFSGAIVYVDEADLLIMDVSLLQSLRNVFQNAKGLSVVLAGTSALFAQVSEIFSPVPRQFHKIEVRPFRHWSDIHSLIKNALTSDVNLKYEPTTSTVMELHAVTGGDPAEIQLYCHHMFREAEINDGPMELSRGVYTAVFQEYRRFSPGEDAIKTIEVLESLSRDFIPASPWLQNASLSAEENVNFSVAQKELDEARFLNNSESDAIAETVRQSYQKLYQLGITADSNILKINDAACVKGLWKSLVKVETGDQWEWRNQSLNSLLLSELQRSLSSKTAAISRGPYALDTGTFEKIFAAAKNKDQSALDDIVAAVSTVFTDFMTATASNGGRDYLRAAVTFQQTLDILHTLAMAYENSKQNILLIPVSLECGAKTVRHVLTFFDSADPNDELEQIRTFFLERREILRKYNIEHAIGKPSLYDALGYVDLHHLMQEIGIHFKIHPHQEVRLALESFAAKDVAKATSILESLPKPDENPTLLNNLAFCYMHLCRYKDAIDCLERAIKLTAAPLFLYNRAVANFLRGRKPLAKQQLMTLWSVFASQQNLDGEVTFMNVIQGVGKKHIEIWQQVPVEVATGVSLKSLGLITENEVVNVWRKSLSTSAFSKFGDFNTLERIEKLDLTN